MSIRLMYKKKGAVALRRRRTASAAATRTKFITWIRGGKRDNCKKSPILKGTFVLVEKGNVFQAISKSEYNSTI